METNLNDTVVLPPPGAARKVEPGFDVRAGIEEARVNRFNLFRVRETQQVDEVAQVGRMIGESVAADERIIEAAREDGGPHGAVEEQNTLGEEPPKRLGAVGSDLAGQGVRHGKWAAVGAVGRW